MQEISQTEKTIAYVITEQSVADYVQHEINRGASKNAVRNYKHVISSLFEWLSEDKRITKDRLFEWRQFLKDCGYTNQTELNYVKGINRYLDYMGFSDIRFNRGKARDIAGKRFGYLTAIEPTGAKNRKDIVWRCVCSCGKEVEYPTTRLLLGNVVSCGCIRGAHFKEVNKYIDGTSLRQSMEEQIYSTKSLSGYTGVTTKRGKWKAYIKYKGRNIDLGCYTNLEDAVKARARGKEFVQTDAMSLLDLYEVLHKDDPALPDRLKIKEENKQSKQSSTAPSRMRATRSNNTSGYPGVSRKRDKWAAKITFEKITYQLGCYDCIEEAIAVRKKAEQMLRENPVDFQNWVFHQRQHKNGNKKQET